jgi:hypothetical protein
LNYYTKERVDQELLDVGAVSGVSSLRQSNCAVIGSILGGWIDWKCNLLSDLEPITCMCHKDQQIYLRLRGLCPDSNIDKFWVPRNRKGLLEYYGIISSEIQFNYDEYIWNMKVMGKKEKTTATSGNVFGSLMLGKGSYKINMDFYSDEVGRLLHLLHETHIFISKVFHLNLNIA